MKRELKNCSRMKIAWLWLMLHSIFIFLMKLVGTLTPLWHIGSNLISLSIYLYNCCKYESVVLYPFIYPEREKDVAPFIKTVYFQKDHMIYITYYISYIWVKWR